MICVLIPVLNEISCIEQLTQAVLQNMEGEQFDLLFIDDGSKDGTLEYIEKKSDTDHRIKLMSRIKSGRGCKRGKALIDGLHYSLLNEKYDIFIEMDGDFSHNPSDLVRGIELIRNGNDVVIASKYLAGSDVVKRSYARNIISFINSAIFRVFIGGGISDYSNGYRFYNRKAAEQLTSYKIENDGPLYLGEVLAIWLKNKLRIAEFPSVYLARDNGQSKVIVSDVLRSGLASFKIIYSYRLSNFKYAKPAE